MQTLPALVIPQIAKLITDHLYDIISAVVGFLLLVFVKDPIKRWWQGRCKLAEARKAMYQDLAEILAELYFFGGGVNQAALDKNTSPEVWALLVTSFYKRIKSRDYRGDLKALRAFRTSVGAEVRGFDNVIGLVENLPSSDVTIFEAAKAVIVFNKEIGEAIATEHFDMKMLSEIFVNVQREEAVRHMKALAEAIGDAGIALQDSETALKQHNEEIAEIKQALAKDEAEIKAGDDVIAGVKRRFAEYKETHRADTAQNLPKTTSGGR